MSDDNFIIAGAEDGDSYEPPDNSEKTCDHCGAELEWSLDPETGAQERVCPQCP